MVEDKNLRPHKQRQRELGRVKGEGSEGNPTGVPTRLHPRNSGGSANPLEYPFNYEHEYKERHSGEVTGGVLASPNQAAVRPGVPRRSGVEETERQRDRWERVRRSGSSEDEE